MHRWANKLQYTLLPLILYINFTCYTCAVLLRMSLGTQRPFGVLFITVKCDIIDYIISEGLFKVSFIKLLHLYF